MRFSPGNCCNTSEPVGICLYTGKYSDAKLLALLDGDYRGNSSRPVPWYVPDENGRFTTQYAWPDDYGESIGLPPGLLPGYRAYWKLFDLPPMPGNNTLTPDQYSDQLDAYTFYRHFGDGLTPAIVYGGLTGSDWRNQYVTQPYTQLLPLGTELRYHPWYLQLMFYITSSRPSVASNGFAQNLTVKVCLFVCPIAHDNGSAAMFYPIVAPLAIGAKYMSAALVPWLSSAQKVCLLDCGLYTCSCAQTQAGNNTGVKIVRRPTPLIAYPTPFDSDAFDSAALADRFGSDEVYPSGNYYFVWGDSDQPAPGYTAAGQFYATTQAAIFPTAEDLRDLDACRNVIATHWKNVVGASSIRSPRYAGLYRCGRPVVTSSGIGWLPEGVNFWYTPNFGGGTLSGIDESYVNIDEMSYRLVDQTCEPTWPGPTHCRWGQITPRYWNNCTSCRVIQCRNPSALSNLSSLGTGQARQVPNADYVEVRSGVCNPRTCRQWSL